MANQLKIELIVDDKGTATLKNFADSGANSLKKIEGAGSSLGTSMARTWQDMAVGSAAIGVAFGAVVSSVKWGFGEMEKAAQFTTVSKAFETMAEEYGTTGKALLGSLKEVTVGTVGSTDLMQKAMSAMTAGFSPDQIVKFGEIARTSAMLTGSSVAESYDTIATAIETKMPRALLKARVLTKEESTLITQAIKLNIEDFDMLGLAAAEATLKQAQLGEQAITDAERMQQFHVITASVAKTIGLGLLTSLKDAWPAFEVLGKAVGVVAYGAFWGFAQVVKVAWTALEGIAAVALLAASGVMVVAEKMMLANAYVREALGDKEAAANIRAQAADIKGTYTALAGAAEGMGQKIKDQWLGSAQASKKVSKEEIENAKASRDAILAGLKDKIAAKKDAEKNGYKVEHEILKSLTEENKEYYDQAIANADNYLAVQRLNGLNELNLTLGVIDQKTDALDKWYDDQAHSINKTVTRESEKQALLSKLDAEYSKKWDALANDKVKQSAEYAKKEIETNAALYKTIDEYSDEAVKAEIARLEQTYKEMGRWTNKEVLLHQALTKTIKDEDLKRAKTRLDYYQKTKVYGNDANKIMEALANDEYERVLKATKDADVAEKAKTDYMIDADLKRAESSDDFWEGMSAQYEKSQQDLVTWGAIGIATYKTIASSMGSTFGSALYDAAKGKLSSWEEYATKIGDAILKGITDNVGNKIAEALIEATSPAWDGISSAYNRAMSALGATDLTQYFSTAWTGLIDFLSGLFSSFSGPESVIQQFATGAWNVDTGAGSMPAIVHQGEMIIPAQEASRIRQWMDENGYSSAFSSISGALQGGDQWRSVFLEGVATSWAKRAAGFGIGGSFSGELGKGLLMGLSPAMILPSIITGGYNAVATDIFGIDPGIATAGTIAGMGSAALLGLGTFGALALVPAFIAAAEAFMDWSDMRKFEQFKDTLTSTYGEIGGRLMFGEIRRNDAQILKNAIDMYGVEGVKDSVFNEIFTNVYPDEEADAAAYMEHVQNQAAAIAARNAFFSDPRTAASGLTGYIYRYSTENPALAETLVQRGMGVEGYGPYIDPSSVIRPLTLEEFFPLWASSYLKENDMTYDDLPGIGFGNGDIPAFTVNPAEWTIPYDWNKMGPMPPYLADMLWQGLTTPPNVPYGLPWNVTIDPGTTDIGDFGGYDDFGEIGGQRKGVDYIPRDNILAKLHEGEAVLNRPQAESWRSGGGGGDINITIPVIIDGREIGCVVAKQARSNDELISAIRRAVN